MRLNEECPRCGGKNIKSEDKRVQYCGDCFWHFKGKNGKAKAICCKVCGSTELVPNRALCKPHYKEDLKSKYKVFIKKRPGYFREQYHIRKKGIVYEHSNT